MDEFILPPTPSWHLSNILCCNDDGLLAYGSRSEIAIINLKQKGKFNVSFINLAHKDKINVVVFSPGKGNFKNCLASCGDDGMVRVWDFVESRLLFCHSGHKDGLRVTGLDWSKADTNKIVSVNDFGIIVCWDLASNTIRRLLCGIKILPMCLACCPHDKDLIAIGCKNGVTLVVDVKGNGKIVHRLRGHEQDVISVSWCPVPYNVIRQKRTLDLKAGGDTGSTKSEDVWGNRDLLLATGGTEKSIFIWRTGSDGRFETILNLPNVTIGNTNPRKKGVNNTVLWTSVLWADPYTLLSTSQFGELLAWDLNKIHPISDKANHKKPQPRLLHSKHYKGCFSIACPISNQTVDRGDERVVWTTAMDKHIVGCKLSSGLVALDITTLGGAVFSMALSPLDPNRVAIGSSDSKVFVWNISDLGALDITCYWKKIIGKVMALCWHPREENWLAYGTSDGHVGLLDVGSNKLPTLFRLHHRKQVYRLCWARPLLPAGADHGDKLALYSVGDGDILQYTADITNPNKEPLSLNESVLNAIDVSQNLKKNLIRSDIVFKTDKSCFAVGNDNGSVYILSCKTLSLLHVLYPHKKLMNNLEWHPETVASDNDISPYKNWFACTCDNIKVYNIPEEGEVEVVATLSGHSEKIVGLAWSPHQNGRLLSASYDYSVQIWDVPSQTCLGVFLEHSMAVMCGFFSPLDPDIVISGSSDNTVRLWHISQLQKSSIKPEKKKDIVGKILKKQKEDVQEATELTVDETPSKQNGSANSSLNSSAPSPPSNSNKGAEDFKKRQNTRAMFSVTGTNLAQAKHFDVLYQRLLSRPAAQSSTTKAEEGKEEEASVEDLGYLDFFGDDKSMFRLLMVEENKLVQKQKPQLAQQSMLWRGDISQMVSQAITKKQLSDWLVSLAPMAGFDMWEQACEAYAAQLVECGEVVKASSYLLFVNKVHEAVRLLADYKQFREAIAIAKCRLPQDDQLTAEVYTEWGLASRHQGSLQLAAHCFLAAGNMQACIETLSRIKELKSLKMAATLASHQGLTELANSLATECLNMAVLAGNLAIGHQMVNEMPQYQYWRVWLSASEVLAKVKNRSEAEALSWVAGWQSAPVSLWDHLDSTCATLGPCYKNLVARLSTNKTPEFERDVWYIVSGQLAAAWGAQKEATAALSLRHVVTAFSAAHHFQTNHPSSTTFLLTLAVIAPQGLFSKGSILTREYETAEEKQLMKSLKAFVCASVVHWLSNNWSRASTLKLKPSEEQAKEDVKKEGDFEAEWLGELITRCSAEVLDKDNISFFIKKAQKEELQNLITKGNLKKSSEKENEGLAEDKTEELKDGNVGGEKQVTVMKTDENLNLTTSVQGEEGKKSAGLAVKEEISSSENVATSRNEVNGSTSEKGTECQTEIKDPVPVNGNTNGSLSKQDANSDAKTLASISSKANKEDLSSMLNEVKKLDEYLSEFEMARVSVPSPFMAFTNMKSVIDQVISKRDPKLAQQLQENCDHLWKTFHH